MTPAEQYNGKRILIWGYGREGKSTEAFLKTHASPACIDIFEGKRDGFREDAYDVVFKSPGIVMEEDHPKFTSQTQVFLEHFRDRVIGVTGTKGKSTTSSMLYHVLSRLSGRKTLLVGNIGKPCLDDFDEIDAETIVVYEMSCHQLAHLTVSPHIAVFLNLFEEHLDYYHTMERYFDAKKRITLFQTPEDWFYAGSGVPGIPTAAHTVLIDREKVRHAALSIPGDHNSYNAAFAVRIAADHYGICEDAAYDALRSFEGLPHRLRYIGTKQGIRFYDDSISTIPGATIEALKAVPGAKTVLIGGMDRGISYELLESFIPAHPEFRYILMYETGKRIAASLPALPYVYTVGDLEEAVQKAFEVTPAGTACVLSPAAASYGYFRNFEERGDVFKELVFR